MKEGGGGQRVLPPVSLPPSSLPTPQARRVSEWQRAGSRPLTSSTITAARNRGLLRPSSSRLRMQSRDASASRSAAQRCLAGGRKRTRASRLGLGRTSLSGVLDLRWRTTHIRMDTCTHTHTSDQNQAPRLKNSRNKATGKTRVGKKKLRFCLVGFAGPAPPRRLGPGPMRTCAATENSHSVKAVLPTTCPPPFPPLFLVFLSFCLAGWLKQKWESIPGNHVFPLCFVALTRLASLLAHPNVRTSKVSVPFPSRVPHPFPPLLPENLHSPSHHITSLVEEGSAMPLPSIHP
ncbi:hypothetical protein LX36DRAFT_465155 [Colletotrichum falcatum]|nr:hypothetical protein LX36DRAFT_465155 [Colletotrichum falcatum]